MEPITDLPDYNDIFHEGIPDDATCIAVKVNLPDYDPSDVNFVPPYFSSVKYYLEDCGVKIIAISSGLHLQGKNAIPHLHYHFIAEHCRGPTNASQHRKRWLDKKENSAHDLGNASFRYEPLDSTLPKWQFLSYPLKEGHKLLKRHYQWQGQNMETPMREFLNMVGNNIYNQQKALHDRQQKCQERKQLALTELFNFINKEGPEFTTFRDMMIWLDIFYISKLDLTELPDPKNYKTNCQKVAVKLGILKYSDL